jgi:hypothetical protein
MTRGKLVYIDGEGNIFVSNEFNGDMYYEMGRGYGYRFMEHFKAMPSNIGLVAMNDWLYDVQKPMFDYYLDEVRFTKIDGPIDFTNYYDFWFSDYVYVRNDGPAVDFTDRDGKKGVIPHGCITVYCFGRYEQTIQTGLQEEDDVIDSTEATEEHRKQVQRNINDFCGKLSYRAAAHDLSKLQDPEKAGFDRATLRLKDMTYNSEEYKRSLEELSDTLKHHYANNDHHPEHYAKVDEMNLFALVEMFCDWCASVKRNKDGDIFKSLEINKKRFKLSKQLYSILKNTAMMYRKQKLTK